MSRRWVAVGALALVAVGLALLGTAVLTGQPDGEPASSSGPVGSTDPSELFARVTTAPESPGGFVGGFAAPVRGRTPMQGFGEVAATITSADGTVCEVCLLAALTPRQRTAGLMFVTDETLGGYDGMLFAFEEDVTTGFWMRSTRLPLSIAYFDSDGVLVSQTDMEPCPDAAADCPGYPAAGPFRYAIEVPQGQLADIGVVGPGGATAQARDAVLALTGTPCPELTEAAET